MTKNILRIIPLVLLLCLFTGCTKQKDNHIYVVCRIENNTKYCFDDANNFYKVNPDGKVVLCHKKDLQPYPILDIHPSDGEYNFRYQLPGLYKGTLESLNNYLGKLSKECTLKIISVDWESAELYANASDYSVRIIFKVNGDVRIYAIDNSDNPVTPPYLIEEG